MNKSPRSQQRPLSSSIAERIRLIDQLDSEDQQVIIRVIDSMLTNYRMRQLLGENARRAEG